MQKKLAIGIDVGGTKTNVGIVDEMGNILAIETMPTQGTVDPKIALPHVHALIQDLLNNYNVPIHSLNGIGIGCTGPVDAVNGILEHPLALPAWGGCPLARLFEERWNIPVRLENDAITAAIAESRFGAGRGEAIVVILTFGTGVGSAAILRGRVYRGRGGCHPEFGHIPTSATGADCECGRRGCLESLAGGESIARAGREHGIESTKRVFELALAGDATASIIVSRALEAVQTAVWSLFHVFAPDVFILGGGMMDHCFDLFEKAIDDSMQQSQFIPYKRGMVVRAQLGNHAGMIGAAMLSLDSCH